MSKLGTVGKAYFALVNCQLFLKKIKRPQITKFKRLPEGVNVTNFTCTYDHVFKHVSSQNRTWKGPSFYQLTTVQEKQMPTSPPKMHKLEQCACVQMNAVHLLLMHPTLSCRRHCWTCQILKHWSQMLHSNKSM